MSLWELRFKYNLTWNRLSRCNKHQILDGHLSPVGVSIPILFKSLSGGSWLPTHSFSLFSSLTKHTPSWWSESLLPLLFPSFWPLLLLISAVSQCGPNPKLCWCWNSSSAAWDGAMPSQTLLNISTAQRNLWYFASQATCAWLHNLD